MKRKRAQEKADQAEQKRVAQEKEQVAEALKQAQAEIDALAEAHRLREAAKLERLEQEKVKAAAAERSREARATAETARLEQQRKQAKVARQAREALVAAERKASMQERKATLQKAKLDAERQAQARVTEKQRARKAEEEPTAETLAANEREMAAQVQLAEAVAEVRQSNPQELKAREHSARDEGEENRADEDHEGGGTTVAAQTTAPEANSSRVAPTAASPSRRAPTKVVSPSAQQPLQTKATASTADVDKSDEEPILKQKSTAQGPRRPRISDFMMHRQISSTTASPAPSSPAKRARLSPELPTASDQHPSKRVKSNAAVNSPLASSSRAVSIAIIAPVSGQFQPVTGRNLGQELQVFATRFSKTTKQIKSLYFACGAPVDMSLLERATLWFSPARPVAGTAQHAELQKQVERFVWSFDEDVVVLSGTDEQMAELERRRGTKSVRARATFLQQVGKGSVDKLKRTWPW